LFIGPSRAAAQWWYYQFFGKTDSGREITAFIVVFSYAPWSAAVDRVTHALHWSVLELDTLKRHVGTVIDPDGAAFIRDAVRLCTDIDPRFREAHLAILERTGSVLLPDKLANSCSGARDKLDFWFDGVQVLSKDAAGKYLLNIKDATTSLSLSLQPLKQAIR
jgi:hypothetical protein